MSTYTPDQLKQILADHAAWLTGEGGKRADLSRANLSGANLYEANLSRAYLSEAYLYGANLSEADLSEANLYRAYLSGADLSRANLSGANLYEANLSRAYLSEADLSGANLYEANLSRAYLSEANLSGAVGVIDAGTPNGHRVVGWLRDGWMSVRGGCKDMRLGEARAHVSGRADRAEIAAALEYVAAVAKLRNWKIEQ